MFVVLRAQAASIHRGVSLCMSRVPTGFYPFNKQSVAVKAVDRYLKDSIELSSDAEQMYAKICQELGLDNILKQAKNVP